MSRGSTTVSCPTCPVFVALYADSIDNPKLTILREASAQKQASEHYAKMHAAGKTDQFKKDMERLREVKQRREKEAAERKAKDEGE